MDWSGTDYARHSGLQRAMIDQALTDLSFAAHERVLDIGCGDGFLTRAVAAMVPLGMAVGLDASPQMIAAAHTAAEPTTAGPWFMVADARHLPFGPSFDAVVSFNALHWVPDQLRALSQIASVLRPTGRALIQVVCAGERPSLESITMTLCRSPRWAQWFEGFAAPFVHVDSAAYGALAAAAGLTLEDATVLDRDWDFGSRARFESWCAVGSTAWTDRLPMGERAEFVGDQARAYEAVSGRPGLFRFTQMRATLRLGDPPGA